MQQMNANLMRGVLVSFCFSCFSSAAYSKKIENAEITHLLNFVEYSDCIYNRNGTKHSGPEARAHIQKKYNYYIDDIKSTEDFIEYSATKSLISGNKYEIYCPNKATQYSQDWLLEELTIYRAK